jgi:hypothetical protein
MKAKSQPAQETEELLKTISNRQSELERMTNRMMQLISRNNHTESDPTDTSNWFETLKKNNTALLSRAV